MERKNRKGNAVSHGWNIKSLSLEFKIKIELSNKKARKLVFDVRTKNVGNSFSGN